MKQKLAKDEKKSIKKIYKERKESFFKEFKKFISRGNIIDLAVGLVIGSAFTAIVTALTQGVIMPWVGYLIGDFDLSQMKYVLVDAVFDAEGVLLKPEVAIAWGNLLQKIIDFLLISLIIFITLRIVVNVSNKIALTKSFLLKKEATTTPQPPQDVVKEPTTNELLIQIRDLLKEKTETENVE